MISFNSFSYKSAEKWRKRLFASSKHDERNEKAKIFSFPGPESLIRRSQSINDNFHLKTSLHIIVFDFIDYMSSVFPQKNINIRHEE